MEKLSNRRQRIILVAATFATATICAGAYIASRGGVGEVLRLPPVLDKSTPAEQQGYRIVEILRPADKMNFAYEPSTQTVPSTIEAMNDPGVVRTTIGKDSAVAGVWITTPTLPGQLNQSEVSAMDYRKFPLPAKAKRRLTPTYIHYLENRPTVPPFYISERASTGQSFPADWRFYPLSLPQVLFVPIPGGYSNRLRWIDIILTDQFHRVRRWRIDRLPAARQALPTSPRLVERASFRGATITARAIRDFGGGIRVDRLPKVPVSAGQQWEIEYDVPLTNWEPVMGDMNSTDKSHVILTDPDVFKWFQMRSYLTRCAVIPTPFADEDTSVEQSGTLTQFDTLTETARFSHVPLISFGRDPNFGDIFGVKIPSPISQTTASGIKVTLCEQNQKPQTLRERMYSPLEMNEPLNIAFTISPYLWNRQTEWPAANSLQKVRLSSSPLVKRYNRPVSLMVQFAVNGVPASLSGTTGGSDTPADKYFGGLTVGPTTTRERFLQQLKNARYVDIDVKVIQRVDIASTPFTLTLPLHDPIAADRPWDSPWDPLIR